MSLALLHFLNKFNKGRWTLKKPTIDLSTLSPSQYPLAYAPFFVLSQDPGPTPNLPPLHLFPTQLQLVLSFLAFILLFSLLLYALSPSRCVYVLLLMIAVYF